MLIRKWQDAHLYVSLKYVSILLILDVDSEVFGYFVSILSIWQFQSFLFWMLIRKQRLTQNSAWKATCFNPSYSGCWFGRNRICRYSYIPAVVSILLILDVDSEVPEFFCRGIHASRFQSFLFWMLIRKPWERWARPCRSGRFQSFLFWMLIRKCNQFVQSQIEESVSILLILDVDSEVY